MNKLLYVAFVDFADTRFAGVAKKINNQIKVFEAAGYPVTLVTRYGSGVAVYSGSERRLIESDIGVFSRKVLTAAAYAEVTKGGFGCCYLRFQFFCGNVLRLLRRLKAADVCSVVEIPTFPYDNELKMQGLRGIPKLICDRYYRYKCAKSIDQFTTYCNDREIYGVPAIALSNGIIVEDIPVSSSQYAPDKINIVSLSSMLPWHGIDRAINGLAEYYNNGGCKDIHLYIAGEGGEKESYEALAAKHGLDTRVTFCGPTYGKQLDELFDKCTVGLCTIGAHRRGELYSSPLKTVEYIARGLAVVSGVQLAFMPEGTHGLFTVPADDSPLDFFAIEQWYDGLMEPGADVLHSQIRKYAREHCDMSVTMSRVIDYYGSR